MSLRLLSPTSSGPDRVAEGLDALLDLLTDLWAKRVVEGQRLTVRAEGAHDAGDNEAAGALRRTAAPDPGA